MWKTLLEMWNVWRNHGFFDTKFSTFSTLQFVENVFLSQNGQWLSAVNYTLYEQRQILDKTCSVVRQCRTGVFFTKLDFARFYTEKNKPFGGTDVTENSKNKERSN